MPLPGRGSNRGRNRRSRSRSRSPFYSKHGRRGSQTQRYHSRSRSPGRPSFHGRTKSGDSFRRSEGQRRRSLSPRHHSDRRSSPHNHGDNRIQQTGHRERRIAQSRRDRSPSPYFQSRSRQSPSPLSTKQHRSRSPQPSTIQDSFREADNRAFQHKTFQSPDRSYSRSQDFLKGKASDRDRHVDSPDYRQDRLPPSQSSGSGYKKPEVLVYSQPVSVRTPPGQLSIDLRSDPVYGKRTGSGSSLLGGGRSAGDTCYVEGRTGATFVAKKTLDERFHEVDQPDFQLEENITIGIQRNPYAPPSSTVTVRKVFDPSVFSLVRHRDEGKKPIFDREEIKMFCHGENSDDDQSAYERRVIKVIPSETSRSDSFKVDTDFRSRTLMAGSYDDKRMTGGGRSSRHSPEFLRRESDQRYDDQIHITRQRSSSPRRMEPEVRLDPRPDPRYEAMYHEAQPEERQNYREREKIEKIQQNPNDLRHNLIHRRHYDSGEDARMKIEAKRLEGDRHDDRSRERMRERDRGRPVDRDRSGLDHKGERSRSDSDRRAPDFSRRYDKYKYEEWKENPEVIPKGPSYFEHDNRESEDYSMERNRFDGDIRNFQSSRSRGRGSIRGSFRGRFRGFSSSFRSRGRGRGFSFGGFKGSRDSGTFRGSRDSSSFRGSSRDYGSVRGSRDSRRDSGGYRESRDSESFRGSRDSGLRDSRDSGRFRDSKDSGGFRGSSFRSRGSSSFRSRGRGRDYGSSGSGRPVTDRGEWKHDMYAKLEKEVDDNKPTSTTKN